MEQDNKIYWVHGNVQTLLIPLEQEIIPQEGEIETVPYYPDEGSVVTVKLVGRFRNAVYTPSVDGNLLRITDDGTLPAGCYGVEVTVENPDGTRYRSMWDCQIVVTNQNDSVLQEWDEFKEQDVTARAAVFFFAKGDPFTYDDFTPEQILELQKPAQDKADELTVLEGQWSKAEAGRVAAEAGRVDAEKDRVTAEERRAYDESARVNAEDGRARAESGRVLAEQGRVSAEQGRVKAEQGRVEAEAQREATFATFEETINNKLDTVSESDFNQIFN